MEHLVQKHKVLCQPQEQPRTGATGRQPQLSQGKVDSDQEGKGDVISGNVWGMEVQSQVAKDTRICDLCV